MRAKAGNARRLNITGAGDRSSDREIVKALLNKWGQKIGYCSILAAVPRERVQFDFVLMEYFGYLQRDPDAPGYQHWLDKLNFYGETGKRGTAE